MQSPHYACSENRSYSRQRCLGDRQVAAEVSDCGCSLSAPDEARSCLSGGRNVTALELCIAALYANSTVYDRILLSCPEECVAASYAVETSSQLFPTAAVLHRVAPQLQRFFPNRSLDLATVREATAALHVSYKDRHRTVVRRTLKYDSLYSLIERVGGLWGFFMGCSILTAVEVAFVPFLFVPFCGKRAGD